MSKKRYHVYILMNQWNTTSYIGITSNLSSRIQQHKDKAVKGFSQKYNINKLVYYEEFDNPYDAISREKQLKGWLRKKKINLIQSVNPDFRDLADDLG